MIKKLRKGFTLVELVVVIAVIAILAAVSIVSYMGITKKAKESNDHMMIDQINLSVASTSIPNRKATVHEMLLDLEENGGFGIERITPELSDTEFVYSYSMNKFAYWKDNAVVYPEDVANNPNATGMDLWFFVDVDSTGVLPSGHSYYVKSTQATTLRTSGGVDVGEQTVQNVIYEHTGEEQDVIIRTNGGTLSIDGVNDHVQHYGSAKLVDIQKVAANSYREHGEVLTTKIKQGRLVIYEEATISVVKAVATDDEFTDIKLALVGDAELPVITRDSISIDSSTEEGTHTQLVLEIQKLASESSEPTSSNTEYVWASVTVNGSGEVTDSSSVVATSKTVLDNTTIIEDSEISDSVVETTLVHNESELNAAVTAHAKYILFANDISHAGPVGLTYSTIIDGDNHKLTSTGGAANEQIDSMTPGWKFYHSVIEVQAANIDVNIRNIDLINNRTSGTAVGIFRTATNVNVNIENAYLSAKQYCVYTHVGSSYQNMTLNYVKFDQTAYNAFYWRGANGTLVANNTTFISTNTSSALTNEFTTFMLERPLLVAGQVYQSSGNDFTFNNCSFNKVQLGSRLQKLFVCGSEDNTIRFNNTDFENTGIIEFGGKMTSGLATITLKPSHIYVNGVESMPLNAGYINVTRSEVGDGRVYWPENGLYSGTFSFDVSTVEDIYGGYTVENNGNGTWTVVPQE